MDDHDFHRRVIIENIFDGKSSVFPLSIVLVENPTQKIITYRGIHFVDTGSLLSLKSGKFPTICSFYDQYGRPLKSVLDPNIKFSFFSEEIELWCEKLISDDPNLIEELFIHCNQPYIYRDKQFEGFERIAMKFPAYEAFIKGIIEFAPTPSVIIDELDSELLRLRRLLI